VNSTQIKAAILIVVTTAVILYAIVRQIFTGTGVNRGTFILAAIIIFIFWLCFRWKKPN
jgi:hypothetical protein